MFPHMYKVRPGKVQQVKEPGMAADCQRQPGENWRRNSGGGSSFQQNPPAIPAPPPDPQDNLTRKPSLPSKEPERKGSTDQIQFIENDTLKSRSSLSPVLPRTRIRSRGQLEPYFENAEQERSYPPPGRRSRARPSEGQIVTIENGETESSDHPRMRTRSRSQISEDRSRFSSDDVCPSPASDTSASSTTRVRQRNRQEEEKVNPVAVAEYSFPPPGRVRSRSRHSEEAQNDSSGQESTSLTPRIRTRSRSRANEMNPNDTNTSISDSVPNHNDSRPTLGRMRSRSRTSEDIQKKENNYPTSIRTRSRSRASKEEEEQIPTERLQSTPAVEQNISLPPPGRRQRETEAEISKDDGNIEITETVPFRSRARNRETQQNYQNQANDNASEASFVRQRSKSRNNEIIGESSMETPAPEDQVVSPPVQTVTIRLRKRPRKQEPEEPAKISQQITNGNAAPQLETPINSNETLRTENKNEETPSETIRRRVRPPISEANEGQNKEEEMATVTVRRRAREPKIEQPEKEESKPEETATVTIRRRQRPSKQESFSQENETGVIQAPQNDQPKLEENKKPIVKDVFYPETMKSEIIVRKRSTSPTPFMKPETSPFARRRNDQNEEHRNSSSPAPSSLKQDTSPLTKRSDENEERKNTPSPAPQSLKENASPLSRRSSQNEDQRNTPSPAPQSLKENASPLSRRRSSQNEDQRHSPSPILPKSNSESPQFTRSRNQTSLEREKQKSNLIDSNEQSSVDEDKREASAESMENNSCEAKPEVVPIKFNIRESLPKENLESPLEVAESTENLQKNEEISPQNIEISYNLPKTETKPVNESVDPEKGIKEDEEKQNLEPFEKVAVHEDQNQKDTEKYQANSENFSNEIRNKSIENQLNSDLSTNIKDENSEVKSENAADDSKLPSNILKIDIKEDDWEKRVKSEKEKNSEEDSDELRTLESEDQNRSTLEPVSDSFKDRFNEIHGETSEKEITQNLSGFSGLDKKEKQERQKSVEKEEVKQEESEEEAEEEDPLAKATRLWLLSKNENSEILEKVLPEIESSSGIRAKRSPEREVELLDPDEVLSKDKKVKPQMIEEWNDDFKEEPKNFTSFTSIKLKSRPPKPPEDKKKSGRIISKDESSSQVPSAPALPPPPPPPPPPPGPPKSKSGIPRPPPPPSSAPLSEKEMRVKKAREKMVDRIKKAARSRPDWKSVMKDIESGAKLRKVSSSDKLDRSRPILPKSRGKGGKFFYDSEKPVVQNQLLGEIQRGVRLRHVKTNDRSKPDFAKLGLRKLRRQLTVEEKKTLESTTPADVLPSSSDEEEDIDQMRDDLASTKTQLAEEIKKNKKLETEQKILQIDLQSLQAEVKKLKRKLKEAGVHEAKPLTNGEAEALAPKLSKSMSKLRMMEEDLDFSELDTIEKDIQLLNDQIEIHKKRAEKAELKSDELNQKLQVSQSSSDEWEMRSVYFEKKYKALQKDQGIELPEIDCSGTQTDPIEMSPVKSDSSTGLYTKKSGSRKSFASVSRMQSFKEEDESEDESSSSSEEDTLSDHQGDEDEDEERDSEDEDEDDLKGSCADLEKREEREFIMWKNRLSHMKDKVKNVRKERNNLRERVKKFFADMRLERKEYLKLKAELKDLLDQMKEDEDVIEEDEEEESEEEEEEVAQDGEAPDWWCDETPQKPKKLKKRKKKEKENDDEDENIVDMSGLEDPKWSESEQEESEEEEEDDNTANLVKSLKERTKNLEENMNAKRKETYQLKSKIDQCEEMMAEEKRRHARLENELHMLLADI